MSARTQNGPVGLAVAGVVAAGAVAGLFVWLSGGGGERPVQTVESRQAALPPPPESQAAQVELVPAPRVEVSTAWSEPTSVLWPVRVELDLIQADYLPTAESAPPIGTGRGARLSGRVAGAGEAGVRAEVRFVAGPNEGRVLACDATGAFGATDLYPGLAVVRVTGPGIPGATREVRLRQGSETQLNLGFGLLANVHGKVVKRTGEPISGAVIDFDGRQVTSGPEGGFSVRGVAGGLCLVTVSHPDHASLLQNVAVAVGREGPGQEVVLTLDEATSLSLSTPNPVGGPGPTRVWILPDNLLARDFTLGRGGVPQLPTREPWFERNPVEVPPGGPVVVTNLRPGKVRVLAFRPGAKAREQIVNLRAGRENAVEILLEPAPKITGIVTWDGRPIPGVEVALEAPDQVRANLAFLQKAAHYLEAEVVPYFPPARQVVRTDAEGRYVLSAFGQPEEVRYLEARGPAGTWAGRMVRPVEQVQDLDLRSVELGDARLVVEFPGRTQGLPMEVVVNGAPQDPYVLAPFSDLVVDSLLSGRWRLSITWSGEEVLERRDLRLKGEEVLVAALPIGAVEGQDEEAWRRAGREWPLE